MQIKVERKNGANVSLEAKVSAELLDKKQNKMVASAAQNMKIDGFRKGKVPANVVKARYGDKIKQDAQNEVVREALGKALEELGIKADMIVGEPAVTKFEEKDGGFEMEMKISLRPTVDIEGYMECIPEFKTPRITKKEIGDRLDEMMKMVAEIKPIAKKRALADGDFAVIDFEGFLDGVAFEGGKARNYTLEIGSNSFIPGFEAEIIGMKIGEEKDISVTFPEAYNNKELAGKPVTFKIKLHEIKVKDIPSAPTEEMLKKFLPGEESPTLETLEEQIKEQIKNEKLAKLFSEEVKPKFIEAILEKSKFDLPDTIVEQEIDIQVRGIFGNLSEDEIKDYSQNPEKIKQKREEFRDESEKSVKLTFIIDELARVENIVVTDQEVAQMIYFEAMQRGQNPKEYFEYYQKQGVLPAIKMSVIEEKLFNQIFNKGK
ncbi:MAG: trigger factor [Sulfurospirillaceae bacterium]|nr:trigger factor [Sulfurospirillaceae bacterium]